MKSRVALLTTADNPYDPYDQFDQWYLFDLEKGYNSCSILARFAHTSDSLSPQENAQEVERAIDEIIAHDLRGIFVKSVREEEVPEK